MNNKTICFFDSGIGGATVLKEVIKTFPNENYIYYADSINNPYGNKTKEELFKIVCDVVDKLITYNPKIIVCACNTATSMVLDDIRKKYKDISFVGIEPAIKVMYDNYSDKKTIILTTTGTKKSSKFKKLYNKYKTKNSILIDAPKLANLIENNKDVYPYLKEILKDYNDVEVVVLGCTHYPIVKKEIQNILKNEVFIDGSIGITKRIKSLLNNDLNNGKGSINIIGDTSKKERILNIIKES